MRVLLVGCGGIGSRHLQSIRSLTEPADIVVVEPSEASRRTAEQRWREAPPGAPHSLDMRDSLVADRAPFDVAVIATSSDVRRMVIDKVLRTVTVRHLLIEKFLFQTAEDHRWAVERLEAANVGGWVNTSRRLWPGYQNLSNQISVKEPMTMQVAAGLEHGLGSNAVHFLDLFAFLSGRIIDTLSSELLSVRPNPKRQRFIEFAGILGGSNDSGDLFIFAASDAPMRPLTVSLTTSNGRWIVDEGDTTLLHKSGDASPSWTVSPFSAPLQSQLTAGVLTELKESDTCQLPTLTESVAVHLPILDAFTRALRRERGSEVRWCPVT